MSGALCLKQHAHTGRSGMASSDAIGTSTNRSYTQVYVAVKRSHKNLWLSVPGTEIFRLKCIRCKVLYKVLYKVLDDYDL